MTARTESQALRGMHMPKVQVAQARTLFETYGPAADGR